ncbi:hypothetical protein AX17_004765 [Amanita inopinata Kibby_2008]|nr:hypothetical protein AX17_004765 [Amanita inopinata Kibby_2008]
MRLSFVAVTTTLVLAGLSSAAPVTDQDGATQLSKRLLGFHFPNSHSSSDPVVLEARAGKSQKEAGEQGTEYKATKKEPHGVQSGTLDDPLPHRVHNSLPTYEEAAAPPPRTNGPQGETTYSSRHAYGGQGPSIVRRSPVINPYVVQSRNPPPRRGRHNSLPTHARVTADLPFPAPRRNTIHSLNRAHGGQGPSAVPHSPVTNPHGVQSGNPDYPPPEYRRYRSNILPAYEQAMAYPNGPPRNTQSSNHASSSNGGGQRPSNVHHR